MAGATRAPRRLEEPRERYVLGIGGGGRERVRRHAVAADAAGGDLALEEGEGLADAAVEVLAALVEGAVAALVGVLQEVLGVVEEAHVEGAELQAAQRAAEL